MDQGICDYGTEQIFQPFEHHRAVYFHRNATMGICLCQGASGTADKKDN
jgi:hypothetical protein